MKLDRLKAIKRLMASILGIKVPSLYRDYALFKKSIKELVAKTDLSDALIDKQYVYIKAKLYNIDVDAFKNDFVALEQEIANIESVGK